MSYLNYATAIKVDFSKEIITNSEIPLVFTPNSYKLIIPELVSLCSSVYSTSATYKKENAFDGSTSTYWRPLAALPQWIGADLVTPRLIAKIRLYCSSTSYTPKNCVIQRSDDGVDWIDVVAVTLPQTAWQEVVFEPVYSRYWRVMMNALWSTAVRIYEVEFYSGKMTYDTSGWEVTGNELRSYPNDEVLVPTTYPIYRITKTPDNLSIILWLKASGRMRYPQGDITVRFFGDLRGEYNVSVPGFARAFTPINVPLAFNPHLLEKVEVSAIAYATLTPVTYKVYDGNILERVEVSLMTVTAVLTDVINLP